MENLRNKRVVVAGLGHFGGNVAAAKWLVVQGAKVLVTDKAPAEKLAESVKQLHGLPIEYRLGEHREEDFIAADLIVASPAVPPSNPYLKAARNAGVPITTEIRLFVDRCPAKVIGVTGTKGKSTTAAMLGEILRQKFTTWVGGNIGRSLLADLGRIGADDLVVLELSSFMLDYLAPLAWSPHVALVTMIAPDHLEWHGGYDAYRAAKGNLFRFQKPGDIAVVNCQTRPAVELARLSPGRVIEFRVDDSRQFELILPGRHNQANAQGAFAAAQVFGITFDQAQKALRTFRGLPHRLELVAEENGVRYFNDSIATIPEAAVAALDAFPVGRVIQIVGGSDKGVPMTRLSDALRHRAKAALCIGKLGPTIADAMNSGACQTCAPAYSCGDLPAAMKLARELATAGDVVLLSPGCASYDQFANFEQRGSEFARLARGTATAI